MKKWIVLLLVLTVTLSLTACGEDPYAEFEEMTSGADDPVIPTASSNNDENKTQPTTSTTNPQPPSKQEQVLLERYKTIYNTLQDYAKKGYSHIYDFETEEKYTDEQAVLRYCYEQLQSMDSVDGWIQSGWLGEQVKKDRQTLLGELTVVKDVIVRFNFAKTDHMGNVNAGIAYHDMQLDYSPDGKIKQLFPGFMLEDISRKYDIYPAYLIFEYNSEGVLSQLTIKDFTSTVGTMKPEYDANGYLIREVMQTNSGQIVYEHTYDDAGQLTRTEWTKGNSRFWFAYTYTDGLLTERTYCEAEVDDLEDLDEHSVITYTYDSHGNLQSAVGCEQDFFANRLSKEEVSDYSYTCDDQGRVIKETKISRGIDDKLSGSHKQSYYASEVTDILRGDYYIYAPQQ